MYPSADYHFRLSTAPWFCKGHRSCLRLWPVDCMLVTVDMFAYASEIIVLCWAPTSEVTRWPSCRKDESMQDILTWNFCWDPCLACFQCWWDCRAYNHVQENNSLMSQVHGRQDSLIGAHYHSTAEEETSAISQREVKLSLLLHCNDAVAF